MQPDSGARSSKQAHANSLLTVISIFFSRLTAPLAAAWVNLKRESGVTSTPVTKRVVVNTGSLTSRAQGAPLAIAFLNSDNFLVRLLGRPGLTDFGVKDRYAMGIASLNYLKKSAAWKIMPAPFLFALLGSFRVMQAHFRLRHITRVFTFYSSNPKGLMGGLGLQGTKITEYTPSK